MAMKTSTFVIQYGTYTRREGDEWRVYKKGDLVELSQEAVEGLGKQVAPKAVEAPAPAADAAGSKTPAGGDAAAAAAAASSGAEGDQGGAGQGDGDTTGAAKPAGSDKAAAKGK